MKIAITADPVIPVPPVHYGGIERIIDMLVKGLVARGHEVTLFAHRDSLAKCVLKRYPGNTQQHVDLIRNTFFVTRWLKDNYDLVHSFGRLAYLTALLPTSLPKIMSYQREPSLRQIRIAAKLAKSSTLVFTGCSEYIAQQIRPFATSYAVPNGVPLDVYTYQEKVSEKAPLVFLGRIEPIKGAHVAIEVAKQTGRKLIIAGNVPPGEARQYFANKIQPWIDGVSVRYVGAVNDEQKNALLGSAAALLMPVLWNEPFGIVMAEALACGTPVIGLKRGAVPEVVQDGVNGFLCTTVAEMSEAVNKINLVDRYNCRRISEKYFSGEAIVNAYEELYKSLL